MTTQAPTSATGTGAMGLQQITVLADIHGKARSVSFDDRTKVFQIEDMTLAEFWTFIGILSKFQISPEHLMATMIPSASARVGAVQTEQNVTHNEIHVQKSEPTVSQPPEKPQTQAIPATAPEQTTVPAQATETPAPVGSAIAPPVQIAEIKEMHPDVLKATKFGELTRTLMALGYKTQSQLDQAATQYNQLAKNANMDPLPLIARELNQVRERIKSSAVSLGVTE